MKKISILTGAGMSAESGLRTFRDSDGLWESHNVYDVATPEAWQRDPELVLKFYNERRRQIQKAKPNKAHLALAKLEKKYDIHNLETSIRLLEHEINLARHDVKSSEETPARFNET